MTKSKYHSLCCTVTIFLTIFNFLHDAQAKSEDFSIGSTAETKKTINDLAAKTKMTCSVGQRKRLNKNVQKLTLNVEGTNDTYHCCDENVLNCSPPVDLLTSCPILKVKCRYENNACICDEGD